MDLELWLAQGAVSFVGALAAVGCGKVITDVIHTERDRGGLRPDLLLQLASGLTGIEGFGGTLCDDVDLRSIADLAPLPSAFESANLTVMSLERALMVDSSAIIQRNLNLLFNRHALFVKGSNEHRAAYYWLLDRYKEPDWSCPDAADRVKTIQSRRGTLREQMFDMLRFGYTLIEELLAGDWSPPFARRQTRSEFMEQYEGTYSLTPQSAAVRAAYYRPTFVGDFSLFDSLATYATTSWNDEITSLLGNRAMSCLTINTGAREIRRLVRGLEPFALEVGSVVTDAQVKNPRTGHWLMAHMGRVRIEATRDQVFRLPSDVCGSLREG